MADQLDIAQEIIELRFKAALKNRALEAPPAMGRCFNCEEFLLPGHRWCDLECLQDWEKRNHMSKIKGEM